MVIRPGMSKQTLRLITVVLVSAFIVATLAVPQSGVVLAQGSEGAYFTRIVVTNGLSSVDLVNGGQASVVSGQTIWYNLTFYNSNVGFFGAGLFSKIYTDGSLVGTSSDQYVWRSFHGSYNWYQTGLSSGIHTIKVELWWDGSGTYYLEDTGTFQVFVVQLSSSWSAPSVSVPRGSTTGSSWTVSVSNTGNDVMHSVSVAVVDSAGLQISPQTQPLGDMSAGATKSTSFTVIAPTTLGIGQYNVIFTISYLDFEGNTYQNSEYGLVTVTKTATSMAVSLDKSTVSIGDTVTIQAALTANGAGIEGQAVVFSIGGNTIGSGTTDSSGRAVTTYTASVSPGTYTVQASFAETNTYLSSTGSANLIVTATPTTLTLSTPSSLTQGSSITLTATLTDSKGNPIQGQSVQFLVNGTLIGSATTDVSGKASFEYTPNTSGSAQIQAVYQGAGNYAQSSSSVVPVQISTPGILGLGTTGTIILVVAIVIVLAVIAYVAIRRRKPKPQ